LVGLNARSEFAGLPAAEQETKIRNALAIFKRERVHPKVWVAPAHSFDETTVRILRRNNLHMLSDGLFPFPHRDADGMLWIPQQMWRFREMRFGVWTICLHHNVWKTNTVARFRQQVEQFREKIATFDEVTAAFDNRISTALDRLSAKLMLAALRAKRAWSKREGDGEA
jgi:predicted deacetylase